MRALIALFAGIVAGVVPVAVETAAAGPPPSGQDWITDIRTAGGDVVDVAADPEGLRLVRPSSGDGTAAVPRPAHRTGLFTFETRVLAEPVSMVWADARGFVPSGGELTIEVRVQEPGGTWSEWREAGGTDEPAVLPFAGSQVQTRVAMASGIAGLSPVLRDLRMHAELGTVGDLTAAPARRTYRVYATRIGLVGDRTANGRIIKPRDHFVALPTRRALATNNKREYTVTVRNPKNGRVVTAPVWDVGPWNIKDDYWNSPSIRQMWQDLPTGRPAAQAAYQGGYNGGLDGFRRRVLNPAGIDLADGTFWDDLKMADNGWVDVTYNWTTTAGPTGWRTIVDNGTPGRFRISGNWGTSKWLDQRFGTTYRYAPPARINDGAWYKFALPSGGTYEIYARYPAYSTYNSSTPYVIRTANGFRLVRVDQRSRGGAWVSLGRWPLNQGDYEVVGVSRWTATPGAVIADAVMLVRR